MPASVFQTFQYLATFAVELFSKSDSYFIDQATHCQVKNSTACIHAQPWAINYVDTNDEVSMALCSLRKGSETTFSCVDTRSAWADIHRPAPEGPTTQFICALVRSSSYDTPSKVY